MRLKLVVDAQRTTRYQLGTRAAWRVLMEKCDGGWTPVHATNPVYDTLWWNDLTGARLAVLYGGLRWCHSYDLRVSCVEGAPDLDVVCDDYADTCSQIRPLLCTDMEWTCQPDVAPVCVGGDDDTADPERRVQFDLCHRVHVYDAYMPRVYTHACVSCGDLKCTCLY